MNKILILIMFALLFNSCSKNNKQYKDYFQNYTTITEFQTIEKWNFNKFHKTTYGLPPGLKIINDKYLIIDTDIDGELIEIYDIKKKKLLNKVGNKGYGPGEFIGLSAISYDKSNDQIWMFDITSKNLVSFDTKTIVNTDTLNPIWSTKISSDAGSAGEVYFIEQDRFVGLGALKSRFCFYNSKGDTINTNNYIAGPKDINTVNYLHNQAYNGKMCINNNHKKIIFTLTGGDIVEIFDFDGTILKTIHGPDLFIPEYSLIQLGNGAIDINTNLSKQSGYLYNCSSDNYIFCAYSGHKIKNNYDWIAALPNEIFIFDWNGNPIKKIQLNVKIVQFDYCYKNNTIYAICYDGEDFFIGSHKINEL